VQEFPQSARRSETSHSPLARMRPSVRVGYNLQEPQAIVIWEEQYGDFIKRRGSDASTQFVTPAARSGGLKPSLSVRFPHGYEGRARHSKARRAIPAGPRPTPTCASSLHDAALVLHCAPASGDADLDPLR